MKSNNKKLAILLGISAVLLAGLLLVVILGNRYELEITADCDEHLYLEWGEEFTQPTVLAVVKKAWSKSAKEGVVLHAVGEVDNMTPGDYTLTYEAAYEKQTAKKEIIVTVRDSKAPVIELTGDANTTIQTGTTYVEEGYTATDNRDGDITDKVQVTVSADEIVYTVTDASGNSYTTKRKISYKDMIAPNITILGEAEVLLEVDAKYEEKGATASDETDGDLTSKIETSGTVDTSTPGAYEITYTVADKEGNKTTATRIVRVRDTEAPVLTLLGDAKYYIKRGDVENYVDPGYTAVDSIEGDLTSKVKVEGTVDTSKLGIYTLTYTVQDSFGNESTATREVLVYLVQSDTATVDPGDKVIYLTFDDGPGKFTGELLDLLDKYNIKATFYVTNQFRNENYLKYIEEEAKRGHTVAIHTYTHNFKTVYSSVEGYFDDLEKMANIIKERTGKDATLIRFPGGSSNAASKTYCVGIMTELTKRVQEMGYQYVDWNVDSKDSDGKSCKMEFSVAKKYVADATINGIKARKGKFAIVLQHDIHGFSVAATEEIILWGLENGYTFLPMDESSPICHHRLNN